ncbi:protein GRAVITROPIC IN THE LIGHT 1-like [Magnolia sinica]|uniref:protein GRAVITROPIC IN THE LIGHT 1-like n=1 Tax=Magnolia sinica TaxID=86752 RepID=UPI00265B3894|nr:protein GRAVITROPIC IN THE LIGHT 1-like [Magnolia sinica]XP_058095497.1 protein GRAVITROPIC IN THE LIGHT 1-like [Magnolia sinica]
MDSIKPVSSNVNGLVQTFAKKVLRFRTSGIAPDDGLRKVKLPENTVVDPSPKACFSQPLDGPSIEEEKEKLRKREAMEALLAKLFASVSAVKAAYAQLQIAQSPYDPETIQSADKVVIAELKKLSELKHFYVKKQILPSQESQLLAEIQEQQNLLKTYEIMGKKLQSQLQLKDSEILFLKEKQQELDGQNRSLEKRLNPSSSLSALNNLHISGLNPNHFILALRHTIKSIRIFVKLMIDEMESAGWDLDAAAHSIEPDAVYVKPFHRCFAFEAYVCRKLFGDFQFPKFSTPSEHSSKQRHRRRHYFDSFMQLKSVKTVEFLMESPESSFGKFCRSRYLASVHPKMEAAFFGDLTQRSLVSSGKVPETPFFGAFAEAAKRVWLLHCLAFSFEPEASIFQVRKGCRFSDMYMESVVDDTGFVADDAPDIRLQVGFTVVPGFMVGKTVVQCKVYLNGWKSSSER